MPEPTGIYKVSSHERQVVGALGSIGGATLASRVLGFVRDAVVAQVFGAGPITDAFFVAFRIPNILRRLLAEGALSTAVIPVFTDYAMSRPRPEMLQMLRAVLGAALIVLGLTSHPRCADRTVAADHHRARLRRRYRAVRPGRAPHPRHVPVPAPGRPGAFAMGVLNSQGRFFAAALGPAMLNVGMIVAVLALAGHVDPPVLSLAFGVLLGGVGQLLIQRPT